MSSIPIWNIHSGDDKEFFVKNNVIAINWGEIGDLSILNKEQIIDKLRTLYPENTYQSLAAMAGTLYRFKSEIKIDDIVTYRINDEVKIGIVKGDYIYDASLKRFNNQRKVDWILTVNKNVFSKNALHEMGAATTLTKIKRCCDEITNIINTKKS